MLYFNRGRLSAASNNSVALQRKSTAVPAGAGTFCCREWDVIDNVVHSLYWAMLLEHAVYAVSGLGCLCNAECCLFSCSSFYSACTHKSYFLGRKTLQWLNSE